MKSIVMGSTLLLTGTAACGGISLADEAEREGPSPARTNEPPVASSAPEPTGPTADAAIVDATRADARTFDAATRDATTDAGPIVDAGPDARHCEKGWPTTKGQICTFENGLECCTRSTDPNPADKLCCPVAVP